MNEGKGRPPVAGWKIPDIRWKAVGLGYAISSLSTILVGLPLLLIMQNSWMMALAGSIGLLAGGLVTGGRVGDRSLAVVNGALTTLLYNFTLSLFFFAGSVLEALPEPLPGLPTGDSTFFFAWPLVQFAIGIFSAIIGSRIFAKRLRRGD